MKRFRFGVQLGHATSRTGLIEKVRLAERLGYDVVVSSDHVGTQLAPFPALLVAAEATDHVRLGTFVLDNDFRHPLLLAHEAASVNLLTEGRVELGLGAGWLGRDYERLGIGFATGATRLQRLVEAVSIIQSYFRGETFSHEGRHYSVRDAEPLPTSLPAPALLIGGGGRRLLEFAALHADIVSVFFKSLPDGSGFDVGEAKASVFDDKVAVIRSAASSLGRDPELNVLTQHFEITNNRKEIAEEHARELDTTPEDLLALPFELLGTVDQIVEDLVARRERFGISYVTVFERYLTAFAPVIERLAGT